MKEYYKLKITGDQDVYYKNRLLDTDVYYFKKLDSSRIISILDDYRENVTDYKHGCAKDLKSAIRKMKDIVMYVDPVEEAMFYYNFGGNQCITIERQYMPEEEDFEDV